MPNRPPQPDLYSKYNIPLERWDTNKITKLHISFKQLTKLEILEWVGGKASNGRPNKSNCPLSGHMTYSQAPSDVWEKHFPLISLPLGPIYMEEGGPR